jgi:biopolymer transport protein ExbD
MSGSAHASDRAEPNMTPILDMVFQLITFFMLVINFNAAETDNTLKLPVVGSARPADTKGQGELLVLNLNADGKLMVRGREEPSIEGFITNEAKIITMTASKNVKPGEELPVTVVIRADRTVLVQHLMRVVRACQAQNYRKFDFMVMRQAVGQGG